jgi:DHA1 family bicyclomycin/chloramphenicol resistance-like MFS transporter
MLSTPLFRKLSGKAYDSILLALVTIMYIAMCAEADMYVPAFPQMIDYFGVQENHIQLILSINFAALCLTGMVVGPLSDSYGRRKVLLGGLFLFSISSFGCAYANDFNAMLLWRLLQGIAASVPMVVGSAIIIDKYSEQKAGQIVGLLNSVIAAAMAGAPIVGAWITQVLNWRVNFFVILGLAVVSFLGTGMFIEETLPNEKRKAFQGAAICRNYLQLSKSLPFMLAMLIANFPFTAIFVYIANLSVIFVNHMGMSLERFSYYQATTMGTFIIFSLLSIKLIGKKGLDYTKNLGGLLALMGAIGIFYISQTDKMNVNMICVSMAFIAGGSAMMVGTFGIKALSLFPEIKGTAMALATALRQFLAAGLVILSEAFFDGTIVPIAVIIFGYAFVAAICFIILQYTSSKTQIIESPSQTQV